ncbi:Peptidyl-prolyl cis-trans isomerase pin1 [Tritrichomonas foetus]|uniref:Peptidyl-prolyl cis-trans isomerase n=1 Tax=Tritrichomonas foetus TaxID=1144522 RepID=A0A1J4KDS1_9EUKA|nr:Peptidyl-prolyl cis-trans isomerase pin1 [Tritrichomonas foetus]|eukprot:OHT07613.1 Peptidyl-prolyl cis-trans isomerase pin1 [Tritrichomonas foetus]
MQPTKLGDWVLRESKDYPGRVYYYNKSTHESTWIRPTPYPHISKQNLPVNWPPLVYVSHILVKHKDSSNLDVWKKKPITRTKEEAKEKLLNMQRDLENGIKKFDELAKTESDCVDTHEKGGEIGWIKRGQFPESFDAVAFQLGLNKMSSDPVETPLGWHLIFRHG